MQQEFKLLDSSSFVCKCFAWTVEAYAHCALCIEMWAHSSVVAEAENQWIGYALYFWKTTLNQYNWTRAMGKCVRAETETERHMIYNCARGIWEAERIGPNAIETSINHRTLTLHQMPRQRIISAIFHSTRCALYRKQQLLHFSISQ